MAVLPLAEILARQLFGFGIPGSGPFVQHLTLWVGFIGAVLAAREGKMLSLATGAFIPEGRWRTALLLFTAFTTTTIATLLTWACTRLVYLESTAGTVVAAGVPIWVAQLILPLAFAVITLRTIWRAAPGWKGRAIAALGIGAALLIGFYSEAFFDYEIPAWPFLFLIVLSTLLGGPIYAALGGAAIFLFLVDGTPMAAVPAETYRMAVSPTLPAIPLFTLTGFLLANGHSSARLLRLFRALFGWMPGGTAVVCAVVCAFFTIFTGGSGVTILALGGLLFQALRQDQYTEKFSLGLLTGSGSLGLLFPPALPLILYGIVAQESIENLFIGGLLPGILLVSMVAAWGVREGMIRQANRIPFNRQEAKGALWEARFEIFLPVFLLSAIFGGYATVVEAAALSALYAFGVEYFIMKDLSIRKDVRKVFTECVVIVGGVLIILGVAMGLSSYMVDARIPSQVVEWTQQHIESKILFLLALNIFLLVVGCFLDIFSATVVVVPLIVPIGQAFGIHPVHLGVIFIANLELGYLTPPVGLNLFLASYRFKKPLMQIYRSTLPMFILRGIGVLIITYIPALSTGLLALLGK